MSSLSNLKVLDLTSHLSGPYCAMILADHGADVVKIEKPNDGDQLRKTPPFQSGESAPFMLWNRNKRSVTLDLKDFKDHQLLLIMCLYRKLILL
jgi:crotonobetainyl-CoA:carnitine CoA-transferase CaiB-like acyl-CoA transferase